MQFACYKRQIPVAPQVPGGLQEDHRPVCYSEG